MEVFFGRLAYPWTWACNATYYLTLRGMILATRLAANAVAAFPTAGAAEIKHDP